jgi:hypothetical protein
MGPLDGARTDRAVHATDKIADVAPAVIETGRPIAVVDAAGAAIGAVTPQAVIATLIGKDARA